MALTVEQLAVEILALPAGTGYVPLSADDVERVERLMAVAQQMVDDYAPDTPEVLRDEATIRFGGYLASADYGAIRVNDLGPMHFEQVTNHADAFRRSGATSLLTRYRKRRAGSI